MPLFRLLDCFASLLVVSSVAWTTPLVLHTIGLWNALSSDRDSLSEQVLWSLLVGVHCGAGLLFAGAATTKGGGAFLQILAVASALFACLILPSLGGYYLVLDDSVGIGISLASIGTTCISVSTAARLMLHKGRDALVETEVGTQQQQQRHQRASSSSFPRRPSTSSMTGHPFASSV